MTNDDLSKIMDTSDEWIQERTGIKERRHVIKGEDTTASLGVKAAKIAIERAGIDKDDIDFIVFATLSPDYYFPGPGVMVQRDLGIFEQRNHPVELDLEVPFRDLPFEEGGKLLLAFLRCAQKLVECGCQRLGVARGDQAAILIIEDDVGNAPHIGGDDGQAAGHSLQN